MKSPVLIADIAPHLLGLAARFDALIDVRAPSEYTLDHLPLALNYPVLSDEERALVGTRYVQDSSFNAKKLGAPLIARNIARHIEQSFQQHDRHWQPLIYCWRGGQRSGAMAHLLRQIGWPVLQLDGGYKAYRHYVVAQLAQLPLGLRFCVISGATGSGKSKLLAALAAHGAQIIDLEGLAQHRGSVLGGFADSPQPSQKLFESQLWSAMATLNPARIVFIEAESRKIGQLQIPAALMASMRASQVIEIEVPLTVRRDFLVHDYADLIADTPRLNQQLAGLTRFYGHEVTDHWRTLIAQAAWHDLVTELLQTHYDRLYRRSLESNFDAYSLRRNYPLSSLDTPALSALAQQLITDVEYA